MVIASIALCLARIELLFLTTRLFNGEDVYFRYNHLPKRRLNLEGLKKWLLRSTRAAATVTLRNLYDVSLTCNSE